MRLLEIDQDALPVLLLFYFAVENVQHQLMNYVVHSSSPYHKNKDFHSEIWIWTDKPRLWLCCISDETQFLYIKFHKQTEFLLLHFWRDKVYYTKNIRYTYPRNNFLTKQFPADKLNTWAFVMYNLSSMNNSNQDELCTVLCLLFTPFCSWMCKIFPYRVQFIESYIYVWNVPSKFLKACQRTLFEKLK